MNNKKIDDLAVLAVENECSKYDTLLAFVDKGGTYPIWDGNINVYSSKSLRNKEFIGRVPVQVKGTEVIIFSESTRPYPAKIDHLKAYWGDCGVIYFVVEILKESRQTKIFYALLTKYDIQLILQKAAVNQGKINIELRALPSTLVSNIDIICRNFCTQKINSVPRKTITFDEIDKLVNSRGVKIDFVANPATLHDYILQNPLYITTEDEFGTNIVLSKIQACEIMTIITKEVKVQGKVFYPFYRCNKKSDGTVVFEFGDNILINITNRKIKYCLDGWIVKSIINLEFMLNFIDTGYIEIGDSFLNIPCFKQLIDKDSIERISTLHRNYCNARDTLQYFGVDPNINIFKLNDKEIGIMAALVKMVINNEELPYNLDVRPYNVSLGIIMFMVLSDGKKLYNMFCKEAYNLTEVCICQETSDDGQPIDPTIISIYAILTADNIANSANFDKNIVLESISKAYIQKGNFSRYIFLCLEAIKAYDKKPDRDDIYLFAKELSDQLINFEQSNITLINKYQIEKRKRSLRSEEKEEIFKRNTETEVDIEHCAFAILLDNDSDFQTYFERLSPDQKETFLSWPIYNLLKKV